METTKYIWMNGQMIEWEKAKIHVITHSLHYGGGAFEGVRAYETPKGPAIFRLQEHTARLLYSARAIKMKVPFSEEEINQAHLDLLKKNDFKQGYIRPLIYYGYGKMGLNPKGAPVDTIIACWPWGAYLPYDMIDVKISSYMRIHPKTTKCDAKITGHYVNSIMAVQELEGSKYHEAILLDYNGNIAEGPGENFFVMKDNILYTPKLGNVLEGITRSTIIELAKDFGISVVEQEITPEFAFAGDEAFFTGTAAEVTPIKSIDDNVIGDGKIGPTTQKLKQAFLDLVQGKSDKSDQYLTYIANSI